MLLFGIKDSTLWVPVWQWWVRPYSISATDENESLCCFLIRESQFLSSTEVGETRPVCHPGGKVFLCAAADPSLSIVLGWVDSFSWPEAVGPGELDGWLLS
jgi:hypothetical protein